MEGMWRQVDLIALADGLAVGLIGKGGSAAKAGSAIWFWILELDS